MSSRSGCEFISNAHPSSRATLITSSKSNSLGFRLPMIIVSPYAKNAVYKNVAHQASIPKFIEALWGMPPLATYDPAALDGNDTDDLLGAFDFQQAPIDPLPLTQRSCSGQR